MRASAFVPGHMTGFFRPMEADDPLRSGSVGAGIVINKGVYTSVSVREADENSIEIFLDGNKGPYPVSEFAAREVVRISGGRYRVEVNHESDVPVSQGFGASAAGALGVAIALSRALGLPLTMNQCGSIAHRAEIANKTGLGDVIAECHGGLVVRLAPGAPGTGVVDRITCDYHVAAWVVGPPLETKAVLSSEARKSHVALLGDKAMEALLRHPDPENFVRVSRSFALESNLMSEQVRSTVKALEGKSISSSMVMLGNSVFALTRDPESLREALQYPMIVAEVDSLGGRLI